MPSMSRARSTPCASARRTRTSSNGALSEKPMYAVLKADMRRTLVGKLVEIQVREEEEVEAPCLPLVACPEGIADVDRELARRWTSTRASGDSARRRRVPSLLQRARTGRSRRAWPRRAIPRRAPPTCVAATGRTEAARRDRECVPPAPPSGARASTRLRLARRRRRGGARWGRACSRIAAYVSAKSAAPRGSPSLQRSPRATGTRTCIRPPTPRRARRDRGRRRVRAPDVTGRGRSSARTPTP